MILRYLHLSDLHLSYREMVGDNWAVEQFNQDLVTKSLLESIQKLVGEDKQEFDFIILTGDITKRGKRE